MKEHRDAVYIGRFQPFHNGHLEVVKHGLELADSVTIIVGSANAAPNIKNPWSFDDRYQMIRSALDVTKEKIVAGEGEWLNPRVNIVPVRDYFYNENFWISEVQAKTAALGIEDDALLIGNWKDASSYYLKYFPQWQFASVTAPPINATDIRVRMFNEPVGESWDGTASFVPELDWLPTPEGVARFIDHWARTSTTYPDLCKEYKYLETYKASWAGAPFPPTFITTDAIVTCSGHVLVVKRKHNPGKGLYALPGGFLKDTERIEDGMLRELREETKIKVDKLILRSSIVDSRVFDHPERSLRGRTITHGFHIKLKDGALPEIKADDDAAEVLWMPLMDVQQHEREFFEDHAHIINYFIAQV